MASIKIPVAEVESLACRQACQLLSGAIYNVANSATIASAILQSPSTPSPSSASGRLNPSEDSPKGSGDKGLHELSAESGNDFIGDAQGRVVQDGHAKTVPNFSAEAVVKASGARSENPVKEIRYGIIGTGMMGVEHVLNIMALDGAKVTAIADPHGPSRQAALKAADDGSLQVFTDHHSLLDSGLCDVVVVATPNMTHAEILLDILQHPSRHHVLVEKPLCTTVVDCKEVVAAAALRSDVLVQVGLEYRYMPPVNRLIAEVRNGAIGRVQMVAIREHRFPFLAKVNNWNRFARNTGGTLVEKCCHFFDLMNVIVGKRPIRVMASGSQAVNHLNEKYEGQVPDMLDNAFVIVEYEEGARGLLDLCMFAEGSRNEQEISVGGNLGKIEAFVPEGIVRIGSRAGGRAGVQTIRVHDDRIKYEGLHHGSSYLEHLEFVEAARSQGERAPPVGLLEGLLSVAVGVAGHKSIEEGRPVLVEEVLGKLNQTTYGGKENE